MSKYKKRIIEQLVIIFGIITMNLGFYFFLLPQNLVTGGVTGISILIKNTSLNIQPSYTITVLNIVFLVIGFIFMGKEYTIKTLFGSIVSPLVVFVLEISGVKTTYIIDKLTPETALLISSVLGALSIGLGLGLVFRNGGSTGGVDIGQNILNKKLHLAYPIIFIITDGLVVLLGLIIFKDFERFIFSVGIVVLISLIVDNLSIAGRAGHTLFIVTNKEEEIKDAIYKKVNRGTTIVDAKGGYSNKDNKLVICVIHKRELNLTRSVIEKVDPEAFTFIAQTKEAVGYGFTH